jgi:Double zinc ribbon
MTEHDWYAELGLSQQAATTDIEQAVERLSRQAAALATTAPERSQLLREKVRSIKRDLLSGPENRQRYDAARLQAGPPAGTHANQPAPPGQPPYPAQPLPPVQSRLAYPGNSAPRPGWPAPPPAGGRILRFLRTGWTCPACGNGALPSDKFCTKCGAPIQTVQPEDSANSERNQSVCASCANPLAPLDVFCSRCGARR